MGPEGLEAGELRLDDRHKRRHHVDQIAAEGGEDGGQGGGVGGGHTGSAERGGERLMPGVEPDAGGGALSADGGCQPGGERGGVSGGG